MPPDEDDLWFLPGPPEDQAPTDLPWPTAPQAPLPDPKAWARTEATLAGPLAHAAQALGRLEAHLNYAPDGALDRLILDEIAALLRLEGVWIGPERLALYRANRLPKPEEASDLVRADWAVRRRSGGPDPLTNLPAFLGARAGPETQARAAQWQAQLAALPPCHALTRAGFIHHTWLALGHGPRDALLEPLALATRLTATPHLPLAAGGRSALVRVTDTREQLAAWLEAVEKGAQQAALSLNRLHLWHERARKATAQLSGRTPARLIAALLATPILSVDVASHATGAAPATCHRNLARFETLGLIREMTGQTRFRFWEATL